MQVLFTTVATKAHFYAQVSLAWALRAAGHEVCVASQPDMVDEIVRAGLAAVPVGEPFNADEAMEARDGDTPDEGGEDFVWEAMDLAHLLGEDVAYEDVHGVLTTYCSLIFPYIYAERTVDELVDFARWWGPDLVVWDTVTFAGGVAARACGAAHARLLFGLDLVGWMRQLHRRHLAGRPVVRQEDPMREWLDPTLERHGSTFAEDAVTGHWTIDPSPTSLSLPVDHLTLPMRYVPYNGPAVVPHWLRRAPERPRVCLTLGLSFREVVGADRVCVHTLLDAVADLDIEVVATLNPEQLSPGTVLPPNVTAVDFVPLNALLPTCSAIVHHGGAGTYHTALAHGVPQIIVSTDMWDATPRAHRLTQQGAGLHIHDTASASPDHLRAMLTRVLNEPGFHHNATRLRTETLATPTPAHLVPTLEKLTQHHRPRTETG
ncbi:activator-dependent family glycosyltransferase [Spirillospora sp. NBC_00431]